MAINETLGFLTPFGPRKIDTIQLDCVIQEEVRHTAALTLHPVEVPSKTGVRRGTISDHAYLEPITHTMRGAISDHPISWRTIGGIGEFARNPYGAITSETRSISAYQLLRKHFDSLTPFDLVTTLDTYPNMLFTRFRTPRNSATGNMILFEAEFREIQIVVPDIIAATKEPDQVGGEAAETGAISNAPRGEVAGTPVREPSVAFDLLSNAFGG